MGLSVQAFILAQCRPADSVSSHTDLGSGVVITPGAAMFRSACGRASHLGYFGCVLEIQEPRRDHAGDLCVAKLGEQSPNIAVDRFLPDLLSLVEVTADHGRIDAVVECGTVKRQQSAFADSDHRDRQVVVVCVSQFELIDGGKNLLNFIADDVSSQFESLAINKLAMSEIGFATDRCDSH